MCPSFPYGIEGGMWDLTVLVPNYCLFIYFFIYCLWISVYLCISFHVCYSLIYSKGDLLNKALPLAVTINHL